MTDQNTMNQGAAVPSNERENFGSAAAATADEYLGRGKELWTDAVRRVRSFQNDAERYIHENPARAVFTALAVGFALGLVVRR